MESGLVRRTSWGKQAVHHLIAVLLSNTKPWASFSKVPGTIKLVIADHGNLQRALQLGSRTACARTLDSDCGHPLREVRRLRGGKHISAQVLRVLHGCMQRDVGNRQSITHQVGARSQVLIQHQGRPVDVAVASLEHPRVVTAAFPFAPKQSHWSFEFVLQPLQPRFHFSLLLKGASTEGEELFAPCQETADSPRTKDLTVRCLQYRETRREATSRLTGTGPGFSRLDYFGTQTDATDLGREMDF